MNYIDTLVSGNNLNINKSDRLAFNNDTTNNLAFLPHSGSNSNITDLRYQYGENNKLIDRNRTHLAAVAAPYTAKLQRIIKFTESQQNKFDELNKNVFSQGGGNKYIRTVDYDQMKMIAEVVLPETGNLTTFLKQHVATRKLNFQYSGRIIKPIILEKLEFTWEPLIPQGYDSYINDGFLMFGFQEHPDLFEIPVILNPFDYHVEFIRNKYGKNEYRMFDCEGNDVSDEIFIDDMFAPDTNGSLTSPMSKLLLPTISHVIRESGYEKSMIQQQNPDRTVTNMRGDRYDNNNDDDDDNNKNNNKNDLRLVNNVLKLPNGNKSVTGVNGLYGTADSNNNIRKLTNVNYNNPNNIKINALALALAQNYSKTGKSTDDIENNMEILEKLNNTAYFIRSANDRCNNNVWEMGPGYAVDTLPAAPTPTHFLNLIERYEQICSKTLNLPIDITNSKPHGHMYSSESDFIARRIKDAAFPYAQRLKHIFNLMISHIYG